MEMYFYCLQIIIAIAVIALLRYKIINPQIKLQVKGCKRDTYSSENTGRDKSTFPLPLFKGSVTVEAAIVLPLFIVCIITIYSFFYIFNYQNVLQMSVHNTAKSIGRYSYVLERADSLDKKNLGIIDEIDVDKNILTSGANTLYAWNKIMNEEVKKYTLLSNVLGGIKGVHIVSSNLNKETGEHDILVSYKMGIYICGIKTVSYRFMNRCYFRAWIGESIRDITDEIQQKTVFITNNGTVYHLYKDCSHIKLSISAVKMKHISDMRNKNGAKYYPCEKCVKGKINDSEKVYIADSGTAYHRDSRCSGIKRDITETDISNVGDRKLCSRCKQEYEKGKSNE